MPRISELPNLTSLANDDDLVIRDNSTNTTKKFSLSTLTTWLQSLVNLVTTPMIADDAVTAAKIENQQAWQTPTMTNGWVTYDGTYNPPGYMKDSLGFVHLRGLIKNGTDGTSMFTLPAGYRPEYRELLAGASEDHYGRIDVTTAGQVIPSATTTAPGWVCIDGLTFKAFQ